MKFQRPVIDPLTRKNDINLSMGACRTLCSKQDYTEILDYILDLEAYLDLHVGLRLGQDWRQELEVDL